MTRNRGHNCQHFVMNRQHDSIFSAYKRMFIIWNIFCNVLFEFHNKNGGCMNGHCHSFDINPNLAYSGWLVSIGNGEETHWHYTVHEPLLFIEELLLVVELWQALDCTDPIIIHHHEADLHRPYLNIYERRRLIDKLEEFFDWKIPKKLQSCIHMFLLKNQNYSQLSCNYFHLFQKHHMLLVIFLEK